MKKRRIYFQAAMGLTLALSLSVTTYGAPQESEPQTSQETSESQDTSAASESKSSDKVEITMKQLVEANRTEQLLSHYHSIDEDSGDLHRYVESELRYYKDDNKEEILMPDTTTYGCYDGENYEARIIPGGFWVYEGDYYTYMSVGPEISVLEDIVEIQDNGDTFTIHTKLSADVMDANKEILKDSMEIKDGDWLECSYKVDSDTLAILSSESVQCHADGSKEEPAYTKVTYDAPRPKGAVALLDRLSDKENLRTITVVMDPGTDEETTSTVSIPKGEGVQVSRPIYDSLVFYKDAACTEVYTGGADPNEDMTVYCVGVPDDDAA